MLLEQVAQRADLLLQGADLALQGRQRLGQGQQVGWEQSWRTGTRGRRFLWEGSQTALVQTGQQLQVLAADPFKRPQND